jgi:phosphoenolpyruvate carboxykinase (ATP)
MLHPERQWGDKAEFNNTLINLGQMFVRNFEHFHDGALFFFGFRVGFRAFRWG